MVDSVDRRTLLQVCGAGLASGLAGCGGGGDSGDGDGLIPALGGGGEAQDVPDRIDAFLTREPAAPNYDGSMYVADAVSEDFVNIYVGQSEDDSHPVFEPAAVQLAPGETVRWNWLGTEDHAVQSIESSDISLDSGEPATDRPDYQVTFDTEGICLYECPVHADSGMKGGIVVTSEPY